MRYTILLRSEPEGGYTVTCPALPAVVTWGETYEQALEMAKECIELVIETLKEQGQTIPVEDKLSVSSISIDDTPHALSA